MTTLTLLLMAIRDHRVATEDPVHQARIDQQYLMNIFQNKPYRSKIVPTQTDRDSYEACLLSSPGAGAGDGIGLAYSFFRGQLTTIDDPADPNDIAMVEEAVLFGLALVAVTAQHSDNVYRIFESLNNTGRRLTQGDLLRNYLFMRLPVLGEVVYHEDWLPLQKSLTSDELGLLFWLDLVQEDPKAKQTETYAGQTARLERIKDEAGIRAEVQRLATLGLLLERILRPALEPDPVVRRGLQRLNAWGTTTVYPLLLHLLQRRQHGSATSEETVSAMRLIESFFVRRLLIGQASKNLNRVLLSAVTEMSTDLPVDEALTLYLSTGRKFWGSDAEVRRAVREQPFYWQGTAAQRSLVLRWLEETYGSNEKVDPATLTVEHVLPQTPTTEWRRMFATDLVEGESLEQQYDAVLHTLGNLTLTGYNPSLGNKPFEFKRQRLAATSLLMSQEIAAQEQWRRSEILARADNLAERVIDLWPGPPPTAEPQEPQLWTVMNQVLAEIPAGTWTTYGDLAIVIGTHPVPVGQRLANYPAPTAHRVLQSTGTVSPSFRWSDPNRTDDPVEVLRSEGVVFEHGHAGPAHRLTAEDLAELIGMSTDGLRAVPEPHPGELSGLHDQFVEQLSAHHAPDVVNGVLALLEGWTSAGGSLEYGTNQTTSCFLMARTEGHVAGSIWPAAIYPTGKVEIVFQHLAVRDPFDDLSARQELRQRLNSVAGIDLPASKIQMRPSFPLPVLADPQKRASVLDTLLWTYSLSNSTSTAQPGDGTEPLVLK